MRRIHPLILFALIAVLLIGGMLWKVWRVEKCIDTGGIVIAPISRNQDCIKAR
jgi:hypothetical protein